MLSQMSAALILEPFRAIEVQPTLFTLFPRAEQLRHCSDNPARNHENKSRPERAGALAQVADDLGTKESANAGRAINETHCAARPS